MVTMTLKRATLKQVTMAATLTLAIVGTGSGSALAEGDAEAGAKVFRKCKACHVVDAPKHRVGPSLQGLIGRTAGTAEGYKYSKAMIAYGESGIVWDAAALDTYLEAPRKIVAGTKMAFPGLKKPEDRENVIAYLMQSSQ